MKKIAITLIALFLKAGCCAFSQVNADSLLAIADGNQQDSGTVRACISLAGELRKTDREKALFYTEKAIDISRRQNFLWGCARAFRLKSILLRLNGKLPEAIEAAKEGILNAEKARDLTLIAEGYNSFGETYRAVPDYPSALKYYQKSVLLAEKLKDSLTMALAYNNMAIVFYSQEQYKSAIELNFKSLELRRKIKDKNGVASSLANIANGYGRMNDFEKSLDYNLQALKIREEIKDNTGIGQCLNNIGVLYTRRNDYAKALEYFKRSLRIFPANDIYDLGNAHLKLGQCYTFLNKNAEGGKHLDTALVLSKKINNKQLVYYVYEMWHTLDSKNKDYKKAYADLSLCYLYRDSVFSEQNSKLLSEMEVKYELGQKETKIALLSEKNKTQQLEVTQKKEQLAKNRIILFIILGVGAVVLFLLVLVFRQSRQKNKDNLLITKQKEEMRNQKELVEIKQKEILDSIRYARRIQKALIANEKYIEKALKKLRE